MEAEGVEVAARADRRVRPPRMRTSFVGRGQELAGILRALRSFDTSVITVCGRSGSGTTRLAIEAARSFAAEMP